MTWRLIALHTSQNMRASSLRDVHTICVLFVWMDVVPNSLSTLPTSFAERVIHSNSCAISTIFTSFQSDNGKGCFVVLSRGAAFAVNRRLLGGDVDARYQERFEKTAHHDGCGEIRARVYAKLHLCPPSVEDRLHGRVWCQ